MSHGDFSHQVIFFYAYLGKTDVWTDDPGWVWSAWHLDMVKCFSRQNSHCTDKKENQIFFIYKEILSGAVAKSCMRKGFRIYEEMRKYFPIYEEAISHIWLCNCFTLNFLIYEENFILFFISVFSNTFIHFELSGWPVARWLEVFFF